MKKSLYLTLALTCLAGALAKADDTVITIKKASDTMATVAPVPDSKRQRMQGADHFRFRCELG